MSKELTILSGDINREHRAAESKAREAIAHALEAGRLLAEAKTSVGHGGWAEWLAAHFEGSKRTAQVYMRLAANREAIEAKTQSSAHLSISGALALLAEPKVGPAAPSWMETALAHMDHMGRLERLLAKRTERFDELTRRAPESDTERREVYAELGAMARDTSLEVECGALRLRMQRHLGQAFNGGLTLAQAIGEPPAAIERAGWAPSITLQEFLEEAA